ncbi:MAG: hypothetical protein ACYTEG_10340 [Planctomycetota bacterium]
MRSAALGLVVMCALAVPAEPTHPLARAVELMRSENAEQRELGSRLAQNEVARFLEPLYKALDDPSPEVRRRARAALEGRIPAPQPKFEVPSWHPLKACGPPDANPNRDDPNAWASKSGQMGLQWLELGYRSAMRVGRIRIHEVNSPGAVIRVDGVDERGRRHRLWAGDDPTRRPGVFEIRIKPTQLRMKAIRVTLDTNRRAGWNEIDAVELVGPDGRQWASSATASSTFATGTPQPIRR